MAAQGVRSIVSEVSLVCFATRGCNKKEERGRQRGEYTNRGETRVKSWILNHGGPFAGEAAPPPGPSFLLADNREAKSEPLRGRAGAKGRETMRLIDNDRSPCLKFEEELTQEEGKKETDKRGKRPSRNFLDKRNDERVFNDFGPALVSSTFTFLSIALHHSFRVILRIIVK